MQNVNLFHGSCSELAPLRGHSGVDLLSFGGLQIFSAILNFSQGFEETVEIEVLSLRQLLSRQRSPPPRGTDENPSIRAVHVEELRRFVEQRGVGGPFGQRVAVPEVRLVDAVEHEIGERDGEDEVLLLPAKEGVVLQGVDFRGSGRLAHVAGNVLVGHGKELRLSTSDHLPHAERWHSSMMMTLKASSM